METFIQQSGVSAVAVGVYVVFQWVGSLALRDASIVDRFWGGGFVLVATVSFLMNPESGAVGLLLFGLTAVWGLRLSIYLAWRNWGQGEDYRYQAMRKRIGDRFPIVSLFSVFALQGALTWFISLPLQVGIHYGNDASIGAIAGVGIGLWTTGLLFETAGDWQLAHFKGDPANRGNVLESGLWRYTRHPNYFGDAVVWWGLFAVACSSSQAVYTALSPAVMTFFLMRVSGVPLLERRLRKTRPDYEAYVARTSAFFPRPPKNAG